MTLPVIRAIAAADEEEMAFWTRTIARGKQVDGDLDQAMALFAKHDTLESTRQTALDWSETARRALEVLPQSELRDTLSDLAAYVVARLN